jgi:hypothetical protein
MTAPFQTVRQILDDIQALHRRQRENYADSLATDEPLARAMLDYLQRRESGPVAALARFAGSGEREILETLVQSPPAAALGDAAEAGLPAAAGPATLARRCLDRDAALVRAYEQLAVSLTGPRVREMFANLAELERVNQRRLGHTLSIEERLSDPRP